MLHTVKLLAMTKLLSKATKGKPLVKTVGANVLKLQSWCALVGKYVVKVTHYFILKQQLSEIVKHFQRKPHKCTDIQGTI